MNELKLRISNLSDYDEYTLGSLLSDINVHGNGEKDDEVYELVDLFVKKIKANLVGQIENGFLTKDSAIKELKKVKKLIKEYINITGVRKIYADNDFDNKSLKNVQELSANEIDKKGKDVMNGVNDIKQRIDGFHEINDIDDNTLESVIGEIVALNENQEREESYADLTGKIWRILSQEFMDKKIDVADFNNKVGSYRDKLKTYAEFTDSQVDDLFRKHGLDMDPEKLVSSNVQSQDVSRIGNSDSSSSNAGDNVSTSNDTAVTADENKEEAGKQELSQEEINKEISELETELADVFKAAKAANIKAKDYLNQEINKVEKEKSEQIKKINDQIDLIKEKIEVRNILATEQELNSQIENLIKEQHDIVQRSGGYPSDEDEKRYHEINASVKSIEEEIQYRAIYSNKSEDELIGQRNKLVEEQKELYRVVSISGESFSEEESARYEEINKNIKFIDLELQKRNLTKYDKYSDDDLKQQITTLKDEQKELHRLAITSGEGMSKEDDARYHEISKLVAELEQELIYRENNKYSKLSNSDLSKEIDKLKDEQKELHRLAIASGEGMSKEDDARYHEINEIISKLEAERDNRKKDSTRSYDSKSIDELKSILADLEKNQKNIQSKADKKVEALKDKLNKLDRLEKLKKSREKLTVQDKKQKRKDLFYKGLIAASGFALGYGMAMVPGVGTIRMEIALAKLAVSGANKAINVWCKKHPEGKVSKIVDASKKKIGMKQAEFRENHPNIANAIDNVKKTVNSPKFNWFVNGLAAGYVTGNVVEGIKNYTNSQKIVSTSEPTPTPPTPTPTPVPDTPIINPGYTLGDTLDVSSISEGFMDSFGNGQTHLMTELGKNVRIVGESNGMYNLVSLADGESYAWLPKEAVDALKTGADVVGRGR